MNKHNASEINNKSISTEIDAIHEQQLRSVFQAGDVASEPTSTLEKRVTQHALQHMGQQRQRQTRSGVLRRGFAVAGATAMVMIALRASSVEPPSEPIHTLVGTVNPLLTFSPDNKRLASGTQLWDVSTGNLLRSGKGSMPQAEGVISPDGRLLAVKKEIIKDELHLADEVQVWNIAPSKIRWTLKFLTNASAPRIGPDGPWTPLRFSADSKVLLGFGTTVTKRENKDGKEYPTEKHGWAKLWDAQSGKLLQSQNFPHNGFINTIFALPPETPSSPWQVLTIQPKFESGIRKGCIVRVWDGRTGALLRSLKDTETYDAAHLRGAITTSTDGKLIAIDVYPVRNGHGYQLFDLRIYDAATGTWRYTLKRKNNMTQMRGLTFSPNGKLLAGAASNEVILWDVQSGKLLQSFEGHSSEVRSIAFSYDSKMLASEDQDGNIKLWRVP